MEQYYHIVTVSPFTSRTCYARLFLPRLVLLLICTNTFSFTFLKLALQQHLARKKWPFSAGKRSILMLNTSLVKNRPPIKFVFFIAFLFVLLQLLACLSISRLVNTGNNSNDFPQEITSFSVTFTNSISISTFKLLLNNSANFLLQFKISVNIFSPFSAVIVCILFYFVGTGVFGFLRGVLRAIRETVLELILCLAEQPARGMRLQEKEAQKY